MYIWTENHEIINFDHYARVNIHPVGQEYTLYIFVEGHRNVDPRDNGIIIAKFQHEIDAKYSRCLLFNALMNNAGAWDATAIVKISDMWEEVIRNMNNIPEGKCRKLFHEGLLANTQIDITGLDEITFIYPSRYANYSALDDCKKLVQDKLTEVLSVDIKWKSSNENPSCH